MNETARKYIDPAHCLQCGRCVEFCPAGAVDRLHP